MDNLTGHHLLQNSAASSPHIVGSAKISTSTDDYIKCIAHIFTVSVATSQSYLQSPVNAHTMRAWLKRPILHVHRIVNGVEEFPRGYWIGSNSLKFDI